MTQITVFSVSREDSDINSRQELEQEQEEGRDAWEQGWANGYHNINIVFVILGQHMRQNRGHYTLPWYQSS